MAIQGSQQKGVKHRNGAMTSQKRQFKILIWQRHCAKAANCLAL
jgi:hypothetical protein